MKWGSDKTRVRALNGRLNDKEFVTFIVFFSFGIESSTESLSGLISSHFARRLTLPHPQKLSLSNKRSMPPWKTSLDDLTEPPSIPGTTSPKA